jgi:hypothetical protein
VCKRIISVLKIVEFLSNRLSYILLRSHWYSIIVLTVHAPTKDKTDDVKDTCYEEMGCI